MNFKFLLSALIGILFSQFALAQQSIPANHLDYHLSWDGKSPILKVDLAYNTAGKDSTVFIYGDLVGGQTNIFKVLGNISTSIGDSLAIHPVERKIVVFHKKQGIERLHYEIDGTLIIDPDRALPNELFRPVIKTGSFYIIGYNLFMDVMANPYTQVAVVWDKWPENMPYFISVAPEAKPSDQQVVAFDKRQDLLMVMDKELIIKKYIVYGSPYFAITSKRDSALDMQKTIEPFFSKFFPVTKNFWQDYHKSDYYFLCILPLFNNVPSTRTGMNLGPGFTMKYHGSYDLLKKEVIAHETSHTWIGHTLKFKSVDMENEWFSEGFNDYTAVFNLAGGGMIDKSEFIKYMNDIELHPHYTSPVNQAPADSIAKYFWTDQKYERLSYQRGFIYAFYLDNQIRLRSGGHKNIRQLLLTLYNEDKINNFKPLTIDAFAKASSGLLPKGQVAREVETYMIQGKLIDFSKVKLIKAFNIHIVNNVPVFTMSENSDLKALYSF